MTRFVTSLSALGLAPAVADQLSAFVALFERWNASINLSAATTTADIDEHVIDSLHVVPHVRSSSRMIDVGSGGGFPAAIIALCFPALHVIALEPVHKKLAFLRTVARELRLSNFDPRPERVEAHAGSDYDAASSRATFDLAEWIPIGMRLVRPGGIVLGFEGVVRPDLPVTIERHPYELGGKSRAIVLARRGP